jgi:alpha-L-fucosidase
MDMAANASRDRKTESTGSNGDGADGDGAATHREDPTVASHRMVVAAVTAVVGIGGVANRGVLADPTLPEATPASYVPATDAPEMDWWRESMKTHDQRIAWWREARFGMFIHWGVYSTLEGEWQGQPVVGYAEHIMRKSKIPIDVYTKEVAGKFNPTKFDAAAWVKLAKDAGMGYLVITSKHHDGFAMYDSDATDYNVVKDTPWHHDPMKDLKAACQSQGVRFGFYYSQAWDWADPNAPGNDWDYNNPAGDKQLHGGKTWWDQSPEWVERTQKYVDNKAIPQVRELLARYHPDILWFDTPNKMPPSLNYRVLKATRQADANVVINSRCVAPLGDYQSTTDRPAEFAPHEGDWEGIPTTNESYGYHKADRSHKPPEHFIVLLAKAAARGGNLMLNVGPRGDGTIDPADVAILTGIGNWMKVNGESIHGTTRTPLAVQSWGESTRKGSTLYLHVFDWPRDGKLVVGGLKSNVKGAYLLADATKASLAAKRLGDLDVQIDVPAERPDKTDSVVVLQLEGAPDVDAARLVLAGQPDVLRVFDGRLTGHTIQFGQGKKENAFVEQWSQMGDSVSWNVRVTQPLTVDVKATYDAEPTSVGGMYAVTSGSQKVTAFVRAGQQSQSVGTLRLEPGNHQIRVEPVQIAGKELMSLRSLSLTGVVHETASR